MNTLLRIKLVAILCCFVIIAAVSECLAVGLELSNDQKSRLKAIAIDARNRIGAERKTLMQERQTLHECYRNYNLDQYRAKKAINSITTAQNNLLHIHLDTQIKIRDVLNQQQFDEFRIRVGRGFGVVGTHNDAAMDRIPERQIINNLNISPDQKNSLLNSKFYTERNRIVNKMRKNIRSLLGIYNSYLLDINQAKDTIRKIHSDQRELSISTLDMQRHIRTVLNEQQFNNLRDILDSKINERKKKWQDGTRRRLLRR